MWINEIQHLTPRVTFGGLKKSGIGSENGIEGLLAFTAPQTMTVRPAEAGA